MAAKKASWKDVKARLADLDRTGLIELVRHLYEANADTRTFLLTRFALGEDRLGPYKEVIDRWLWPDLNQQASVAKAKQAITSYKKAIGDPAGLAELTVFYCEQGTGFCADLGFQDESFIYSMGLMYQQACRAVAGLPAAEQPALWARLDRVWRLGHRCAMGLGDVMEEAFAHHSRSGRQSA